MQAEAWNVPFQRYIGPWCIERNTAGHQCLQRLTLDLDARQAAGQGDPTDVPEARRTIDQLLVLLLDMHTDQDAVAVTGELIALHATHLHLAVRHRAADFQRTQGVGEQHHVQARRFEVERRRLGTRLELTLWPCALLTRTNGDVVTFDQGFQASDSRQGNRRFDYPELCPVYQVVLGQWVECQLGRSAGQVVLHLQGFQRAHLDALVHDRRATRLQAFIIAQLHFYPDTRLGGIEVLVQAERQARIGGRTVLAVLRRGEGDTTRHNARQRLTAHLHTRKRSIDADTAGVPETRVLAHQAGVGRLDEDFHLYGALVLGQAVAFHPANLNLLVEHRAVTIERAQPVGLEGQVQAWFRIRERWRHLQCHKAFGTFPLSRANGDVVTRHQCFKARYTGQADTRLHQPETRAFG